MTKRNFLNAGVLPYVKPCTTYVHVATESYLLSGSEGKHEDAEFGGSAGDGPDNDDAPQQ